MRIQIQLVIAILLSSTAAQACEWQYYAGSASTNGFNGILRNPAEGTTTIVCKNPRSGETRNIVLEGALQSASAREQAGRAVCCEISGD